MAVRKAKVWNENSREYSEHFKDSLIVIAPKSYVVMEEPEAVQFMGSFTPIVKDGQGRDLKPKMLRLEIVEDGEVAPPNFSCMLCNESFQTKDALVSHSNASHKEKMIKEK